MADVFISYAREDKARADQIARMIQAAGYDVFWDSEVPPGQTWADYIESKLSQCKAMIVLWSATSTQSQWVREEARMARDKGVLIPAMLDASPPPFGFGEVQAANLAGWNGSADAPEWRRLMGAVSSAVGAPTHAPRPQPQAQNFFTPPPSQPTGDVENLSPIGYIQKCLRMYVNGAGRARRSEYWWFALFQFAVFLVAYFIDASTSGVSYEGVPNSPIVTGLAFLALVCPAVSVVSRRLHDIGLSGWLALVGLVPYLGGLFVFVVALIPSKSGPNQYGPNPKGL